MNLLELSTALLVSQESPACLYCDELIPLASAWEPVYGCAPNGNSEHAAICAGCIDSMYNARMFTYGNA